MITFFRRFISLIKFFRDKDIKFWKKIIVMIALIYFISPIDVLPDFFIPVAGLIDDVVLWAFILIIFGEDLDQVYNKAKRERAERPVGKDGEDLSKKFKDAIVEDDFEIQEEDFKGHE